MKPFSTEYLKSSCINFQNFCDCARLQRRIERSANQRSVLHHMFVPYRVDDGKVTIAISRDFENYLSRQEAPKELRSKPTLLNRKSEFYHETSQNGLMLKGVLFEYIQRKMHTKKNINSLFCQKPVLWRMYVFFQKIF